ncbi:MAG: glycosyltransferase family 4 protein [Bacteroidia bacterium]|nr:glycosyltransferase family 4 protein [Bacteroidia bacterium]
MKRIWLINQYAMPPQMEPRLRTIKFAQYLTLAGYDVTIFASSVMHNMNMNLIDDGSLYIERQYDNLKFVHINTKLYRKNGLGRIIGLLQFPFRLKRVVKNFPKPDIILHTATVPFSNPIHFIAKRLNAKHIVEVLDLWPETFVDLGMLRRSNPITWFLYRTERWLYERADELVFSMEGGKQYLREKGWTTQEGGNIDLSHVHYINNGVDLDDFNRFLQSYKLNDPDLIDPETKRVIYLGSIRRANHLKHLIDAAEKIKNLHDVRFLIYGDGDDRESLISYCKEHRIDNVIFKEKWIDPKYVPYVLSCANVNILNYLQGKFGRYGGSQSKMFQYMASGQPICCNLEMMFCPITKNNLGIAKDFSSSEEYAEAICKLVSMTAPERLEMQQRLKDASKSYDYKHLTSRLEELFK